MNKKNISYAKYKTSTGWEKLDFLANAKCDKGNYIIDVATKLYHERLSVNTLVFQGVE